MPRPRKRHSADFKARVALEAIRGLKTTAQLASEFQVHPVQISQWKRQALDRLPEAFGRETGQALRSEEELTAPLYQEIRRLKMELDWLRGCIKTKSLIYMTVGPASSRFWLIEPAGSRLHGKFFRKINATSI